MRLVPYPMPVGRRGGRPILRVCCGTRYPTYDDNRCLNNRYHSYGSIEPQTGLPPSKSVTRNQDASSSSNLGFLPVQNEPTIHVSFGRHLGNSR